MSPLATRRRFPRAFHVALVATAAALLLDAASASGGGIELPDRSVVRLLTVGAVLAENETTGATVLDGIVAEFEAQTGYEVVVTQGAIAQAQIRAFRVPEVDGPIFWPAANQNDN